MSSARRGVDKRARRACVLCVSVFACLADCVVLFERVRACDCGCQCSLFCPVRACDCDCGCQCSLFCGVLVVYA